MRLLALLLFMLVLMGGALATNHSDNSTVLEETDFTLNYTVEEVDAFHTQLGGEVRHLQLLRQVIRNVYVGEEVLNYLENNETGVEARIILEHLSLLAEEMQREENHTVGSYLAFKAEAMRLTLAFRHTVQDDITDGERRLLQQARLDLESDLRPLQNRIDELTRAYNTKVLQRRVEAVGGSPISWKDGFVAETQQRLRQRHTNTSTQVDVQLAELQGVREQAAVIADELRTGFMPENRLDIRERIEAGWSGADSVARVHAVNDRYRGGR